MKQSIKNIATTLDQAAFKVSATQQVSQYQTIDLDDAYTIQAVSLKHRFERGETLTGYKLGFTSRAKMEQMGIHDIIWGRLTDEMHIQASERLSRKKFIHPRVEPEIAFLIKKKIDRVIALEETGDFLNGVAGALEIIDSRYKNFKFSLEDVVADNCSSAAYVLGEWFSPTTPISGLAISLKINGVLVQTGNSNAILGNPLASLVEMSRMAHKHGFVIEPGAVILAGAASSAVHINAGDSIEAQFENLGPIKLAVKE